MKFWQDFLPPRPQAATWRDTYDARMPDDSILELPLRDRGATAVAGLIANQASFTVMDRLSGWMAALSAPYRPEVVVGLPTLGHVFGQGVARALGHAFWVAPGTTRKLWYQEALSAPTASITAPEPGRRMWLDPNLLPRLAGRRVLMVDDVISTGRSSQAGLTLLGTAGIRPVAVCVAMAQTQAWQSGWPGDIPLHAVFHTPLLHRCPGGWIADPGAAQAWPRRPQP